MLNYGSNCRILANKSVCCGVSVAAVVGKLLHVDLSVSTTHWPVHSGPPEGG